DAKVKALVQEFETWLHAYHAERQKNAKKGFSKDAKKGGLPAILQRLIDKNKKTQNEKDHYVGSQRCVKCHQQKVAIWKKTRHARAMESLKARKRENDPDCYRCHVTGIVGVGVNQAAAAGQPENPFAKLIQRQHRQHENYRPNVQCEACHGPGSRHAASPEKAGKMTFPDEQGCRQCHTRDTDPDFSYQEKIHRVCP
ncbi:MAG: multiheme c-type cytochrome, partial [Pseudomonadota bacterium]|nr:multiheme c-type cytochrome [Pseudomonadota bacterium]